jgi:GntR family transcriptional regulator, rspAB operon transcriptional repressor
LLALVFACRWRHNVRTISKQPDVTSKRGRRWPNGAPINPKRVRLSAGGDKPLPGDVYALLRRMILHSQLKPGEWLRQVELASRLGVSRTPVREALHLLGHSGLVELIPNHGARVAKLSFEEFEEIYALRIGIEGLAARLSATLRTPEHCDALRVRLAELRTLEQTATTASYLKAEWQFRLECYAIAGRDRMLAQIKDLREQSERYLKLAYTDATGTRESLAFHVDLFEAIAAGDAAAATTINQNALRWTLARAGAFVQSKLELKPAQDG